MDSSRKASTWSWWKLALLPVLVALNKKYWGGGVSPHFPSMQGQVIIVTGANTGIGKETARELAKLNATVILAGRDSKRINAATEEVKAAAPWNAANVHAEPGLDLSDLASVNAFAQKMNGMLTRLDRLILNAGVMIPPYMTTADGYELQWGTNHVGHQALTTALLPLIKRTAGSRVIAVSSMAHNRANIEATIEDPSWSKRPYDRFLAYADSKHANVLMAYHLQKLLVEAGSDALAFSLHPGVITTELTRHVPYAEYLTTLLRPLTWVFMKDSWQGAQTQLYLATAPTQEVAPHAGRYYSDCAPLDNSTLMGRLRVHKNQFDDALAARLWAATELEIAKTGKMAA